MRKIVSFMHVSLDGFVAGPNGEMDWIHVDDEIFDYAGDRTNSADTAIYGGNTFQMMQAYWPTAGDPPNASRHDKEHSAWYNSVDKVVISRSLKGKSFSKTTITDNIPGDIDALRNKPGKEIIIFGSVGAVHSLQQHDLIDEYWLFVNPVLQGEGKPMFRKSDKRVKLELIKSHAFRSGVVCLHHRRIP